MEKNKNILYLVFTIVIAILILVLLYFYNQGQQKVISVNIHLNNAIDLDLSKIYIKPLDQTRKYVIFYAEAKNNTDKSYDLSEYFYNKKTEIQWPYITDFLQLRTIDNQVCKINNYYTLSKGTNNIGYIINGWFAAKESRFGYLVFECPKGDQNKYIINYENQNIETGF